jgi:hypothetical protein
LYAAYDESFSSVILLAERELTVNISSSSTRVTKLMDKGVGRLAEIGVWNKTMSQTEILELFRHGADT